MLGVHPHAANDSKLKRELDDQLPAESRHTFPAVSKKWIKTVRYVDPVLLDQYDPEKVSDEEKKRFEKQEVLSVTGKEEGDRRVLTYDPAGKLRFIGDWRGDDGFTQSVYASGSISAYMHYRKDKLIEAYSVSPDGADVHRVVRGNGMLKFFLDQPNEFARHGYHGGEKFFHGYYIGKKLDQVNLTAGKDQFFRWRDGSAEFFFESKSIWWGCDRKGQVKLKKLDGEYDLKKLDPERVKLWEQKYAESIAVFFDRYDAVLRRAGYTWAKLDIEFVRKGRPFPDE